MRITANALKRMPYSLQRRHRLAEEAVCCQPVSAVNSLLTGKFTGNFADSASPQRFSHPIDAPIQTVTAKFPTQQNREFLLGNREGLRANRELSPMVIRPRKRRWANAARVRRGQKKPL